ncbi:unnamed protein product, partial [Symbiodinium sp. CCMP2456]
AGTTTGAGDPLDRLLQGLEKVIKGTKPEEISKSVVEAPKLPEVTETSAVDFGDWLHCVENVMGDLSASSAEWWKNVVEDAMDYYKKYQDADQFGRLALKPELSVDTADPKWSRVDRRGASILLASTPDEIRRDLVAARARTTLEILARLMIVYRPGSATEKSMLLRKVESPEPATTVQEAIAALRQWSRFYQRAKDLGLATPDPSILLRSLEGMVKRPVSEHNGIAFRMNPIRYHLRVDFAPSETNVLAIHRAYLAEFEQLGYKRGNKVKDEPSGQTQARIRAVEAPPGSTPMPSSTPRNGINKPCRFFSSEEGCRRGKACKFEHPKLSKSEAKDRCFECGGRGHMSWACPTKQERPQQRALSMNDSPQSSTGGTGNKKGNAHRGQVPRGNDAGQGSPGAEQSSSTTTATDGQGATESPVQGVPVEQLIEDAQRLMKAFMEQKSGPAVRVFRVDEVQRGVDGSSPALKELLRQEENFGRLCRMGLLDSGATHPLRAKTAIDVPAGLGSVSVTLAGETRVQMDQNRAGTILGDEGTQPIVPLGTLVKALGYEFAWDKRGCRLKHPTKREVKVYTKSTCPEVSQCDALRLIAELEEAKLTETMESLAKLKASICASKTYKEREWTDNVRDYMLTGTLEDGLRAVMGAPFMNHVPMEDQLKVVVDIPTTEQEAWKWMKSFPLNRSRRRQLWQAQQWTVHLFSGNGVKNDPLRDLPGLLEIDSKKGWDLKNEKMYGVLLWAGKGGRIKHVFGGPPGATYSPLRFRQNGEPGPRAVRSMHEPWGLKEGLGVEDEARVRNENQVLFKMIWLWLCAEAAVENQESGGSHVGFCLEFPEDPKLYMSEGPRRDACVSVWSTEFMRRFVEETGMVKFQFEQGALGHVMRRPTCCLSNLGLGINGLKDSRCWTSKEDGQDVDQTIWPHGFRITLADAIHEWNKALNRVVVKKAMSKTEMAGTGRPARRVVHRDAYAMSLDIAGPFADGGRDEVRGRRYKFVLAATYLYPKVRDIPEDEPLDEEEGLDGFLADEEDSEVEELDPVDDGEMDAQEEEWKKKVEELKQPMEMQMLRFCVPLERHTGKEILECVQDLYVKIRAMGLPLTRIHSDRAREFRVKPVKKWCRERDIYQTFTEGLTPTENAVVEGHVKWLKAQARVRLQAAELDKELWPCTMKHACQVHNARQLGLKIPDLKFGSVVWVKSKKDRGPFDPRWERGIYMGPADDVREGHVVRLDDGLWLRTLHMRTVRDDEVDEEDEAEHVVDLIEPTRRVRSKTKLSDPEIHAMKVGERRVLVDKLLASPIWESKEAKVERPQMKEGDVWDRAAYLNLGAYQHGGITSITSATEKFAQETELAAKLLALDHPDKVFRSIALVKNALMPVHKDSFNLKSTVNLVSPLKTAKGSYVWQEMKPGDEFYGNYASMWVNGKEVPGQKFSIEKPITVRPDRLHAPMKGDEGDRIVAIGYTVSKWEKLTDHQCEDLKDLGFTMPERSPMLKMMNVNNRPSTEENMEVSSATPAPQSLQTSSSDSGSRTREYLPEMGGERLDSMVVPGGRVELRLRWAIKYCPDNRDAEEVVMTSTPLLPLGYEEEQRMRSRVTWLSEFAEEERQIRARQAERGEYATQRERVLFYKLDEAIDYMNELLSRSHQAREEGNVNLMALSATVEPSLEVESMLQGLTQPLETAHGVELVEVKRNLGEWKESIQKELSTLLDSGTLRTIPLSEARRKAQAEEIVLVPAKTVHTVKPPSSGSEGLFKRKSRLVICGNYVNSDVEVYTAAANAESVRVSLSYAAKQKWHGAITDVNAAFTLTPMEESKVKYAITVPKVVVDAGCVPPDKAFMVDRVLYGLREAPRLWGSFRDRRVAKARLQMGGKDYMFLQMETDPAVWRLVACDEITTTKALMVIYVDDVMMLGPKSLIEGIYKWITEDDDSGKGWKCSAMEWLGRDPVRYLGMDVRRKETKDITSFHISQGSYVQELLKSYPEEAARPSQVPASREVMPNEDEEERPFAPCDESLVKQAQKMAGELLWLVTRTRPDIGFSTAHVCAAATKSPQAAIKLA